MTSLHVERPSPGVVLLRLDRPPVNALDPATLGEMNAKLEAIATDMDVRAVVLTGTGKVFCAGADVKAIAAVGGETPAAFDGFRRLIDNIEQSRVPVIGALNGACVGGGLELSLACDIRIGTERTSFLAAGVNMGLLSGTIRLPRLIGMGNAALILMTGDKTDAETALRYGLISEVHTADALLPRALEIAARIATRAPLAVEANKRLLRVLAEQGEAAATPQLAAEIGELAQSNDHKLAVRYFGTGTTPPFARS